MAKTYLNDEDNADLVAGAVVTTVSGTDTYTATPSPAITSYTATRYFVKFTNANTGASTINLNGLGAKALIKNGATALEVGDIVANQIYSIAYDGVSFQLVGKVVSEASGSFLTTTVTTPLITTTLNDYSPTGLQPKVFLRMNLSGNREIRGLDSTSFSDRDYVQFVAIGGDLKLKNENASSLAPNRFSLDADYTIPMNMTKTVFYDATTGRWRA